MSRRIVLGVFEREEDILGATREARARGLRVIDTYTPYAVHGLDKAMGLGPSRLPWVCFALGLLGAGLKVWFEFWTTAVDWPLNVGGKPWNSLPAFVPVTFEVMVLFAGVSTVLAFFFLARLRPGKKVRLIYPGVTDDRFVLVLEETDAAFDLAKVKRMLDDFHAVASEERLEEEAA
jgi:hypothetical protein